MTHHPAGSGQRLAWWGRGSGALAAPGKEATTRAWRFTGTNEPLVLSEVPDPAPGPGQVLIAMKAAGLCHSDVGLLHDEGWLSMLAKRRITIGTRTRASSPASAAA